MTMQIERLAKAAEANNQREAAKLLRGLAKTARSAGVPAELPIAPIEVPIKLGELAGQFNNHPIIAESLKAAAGIANTEAEELEKRKNARQQAPVNTK